jgi:hypothetical protein
MPRGAALGRAGERGGNASRSMPLSVKTAPVSTAQMRREEEVSMP